MIYYLEFATFLSCLYMASTNFNAQPTYTNLGLTGSNGTQIVISPDESVMAVGFTDGTVKMFDIGVNELCASTSSSSGSEITDLLWFPSFGPVSLDAANTIILWSLQCNITNTITFNENIRDIAGHEMDNGNGTMIGFLAVNFENRIEEYQIETGSQTMVYNFPQTQQSLEMIYNADGADIVLLVSMNTSIIRKFQILNGTELAQFLIESPIEDMVKISVYTGDVVIGIAQNNDVIRFDSAGEVLDRGNFDEAVSITICSTTKQFALAHSTTQSIGVYLYAGQIQQSITSLVAYPRDIDCSASYLVSLDESGYIHVYTYQEFKSYIIWIIAGVLGGLLFVVVVIIVIIKCRSRLKQQENEEQSKNKTPSGNKYIKSLQKQQKKRQSIQMLKVNTLETTMRE